MISGEEATNVLLEVNQGTYKPRAFSTTSRTFTPAYPNIPKPFVLDPVIHEPQTDRTLRTQ